jgi:uncharacterized membrane protein
MSVQTLIIVVAATVATTVAMRRRRSGRERTAGDVIITVAAALLLVVAALSLLGSARFSPITSLITLVVMVAVIWAGARVGGVRLRVALAASDPGCCAAARL